jgi:acyl carrier protein
MNEQEILATFTETLRDVLGDDAVELTLQTVRSDIPNWDSFAYITFIAAVEMKLGIKYRIADVESFGNVGEIVARTKTMLQKSKS